MGKTHESQYPYNRVHEYRFVFLVVENADWVNGIFISFNPCTLVLLCIALDIKYKLVSSQLYLDVCYDLEHEK